MAQYSVLNEANFRTILSHFGIDNYVEAKVLSGGSENTNYSVRTSREHFVLSICEQKSEQSSSELAYLLEHLKLNGFKTSEVVKSQKGMPIIMWNDKPIMLKRFLEGKIVHDLSSELLKLIGMEMAKLHNVPAPNYIPKVLNFGKEKFGLIQKYEPESDFDFWLNDILKYLDFYFDLQLPQALIHTDVFCDNVIVAMDEKSVVIMDFEEATYCERIFDLGMAIIGLCAEGKVINFGKAAQLLNGYQKVNKLTDQEIDSLQAYTIYAGASMTFWRHSNFRYINPIPEMKDHYQGLKVLVDFTRSISTEYFMKHIISSN